MVKNSGYGLWVTGFRSLAVALNEVVLSEALLKRSDHRTIYRSLE